MVWGGGVGRGRFLMNATLSGFAHGAPRGRTAVCSRTRIVALVLPGSLFFFLLFPLMCSYCDCCSLATAVYIPRHFYSFLPPTPFFTCSFIPLILAFFPTVKTPRIGGFAPSLFPRLMLTLCSSFSSPPLLLSPLLPTILPLSFHHYLAQFQCF